jgi:plasmid stabilization system protein ParE
LRDLNEVLDYFEDLSPPAGPVLCSEVLRRVEGLLDFPEMAPPFDVRQGPARFRALSIRTLRVIYRVDLTGEQLIVLRAWDGRRDPEMLEVVDVDEVLGDSG